MTSAFASALVLAALAAGCERRGQAFECSCAVLTDFDDATKHVVEVCSPTAERAPAFARGCAQAGAPAKVESCACQPLGGDPCELERCVTKSR